MLSICATLAQSSRRDLVLFVYREAYYLERASADLGKEDLRIARLAEVRNHLESHYS